MISTYIIVGDHREHGSFFGASPGLPEAHGWPCASGRPLRALKSSSILYSGFLGGRGDSCYILEVHS